MKRKRTSIILILALCLSLLPSVTLSASAADYSGGSGTESDPYLISSAANLKALADAVNGGSTQYGVYFKLTKDISLSAYSNWTPIGNSSRRYFEGSFDGGGHKITGLKITSVTDDYAGLFGHVDGFKAIQNLGVEGAIKANAKCVGGIVGYFVNSTIQNCYFSGSVTSTASGNTVFVGGIVGYCDSFKSISSCYNIGTVTGENAQYVGGIAGYISSYSSATMGNCYNTGAVTGGAYVGGVAGYTGNPISNCYNFGSVTSATGGSYVGGVVGHCYSSKSSYGSVENCYYLAGTADYGIGYLSSDAAASDNGASPLPEANFKTQNSFNNWDFDSIWKMSEAFGRPTLQNPAERAIPTYTAPKSASPTYNGGSQKLITAGTAQNGTMQYAIGTSKTTAPSDGEFSGTIPTGTDAGTYYVWYKVFGTGGY
ncbi:MAG: hypothetical protein J1E06_01435, partial [Acutalibacter sp.]|nr:hypothetical protein [Acutalibacter sp.]